MQMRIWQSGAVIEILCACFRCNLHGSPFMRDMQGITCKSKVYRLPYVKYLSQYNISSTNIVRAARRAFLHGRANDE